MELTDQLACCQQHLQQHIPPEVQQALLLLLLLLLLLPIPCSPYICPTRCCPTPASLLLLLM
jgi:hypothetical protein